MSKSPSRHAPRLLHAPALRWLLAWWTLLVLPAIAQPLHDHARTPMQPSLSAEHCAGHTQPATTHAANDQAEQNCLCLQACTSATAMLPDTATLSPLHARSTLPFATLAQFLPPSPLSLPFRPPIATPRI